MQKITLSLKNSSNTVPLENFISTTNRSRMIVRNAYVYWLFNNVKSCLNDTIHYGGNPVVLKEEYWSFDALVVYFSTLKVSLRRAPGGKCDIRSNRAARFSLGTLGPLLGFDENQSYDFSDGWTTSLNMSKLTEG